MSGSAVAIGQRLFSMRATHIQITAVADPEGVVAQLAQGDDRRKVGGCVVHRDLCSCCNAVVGLDDKVTNRRSDRIGWAGQHRDHCAQLVTHIAIQRVPSDVGVRVGSCIRDASGRAVCLQVYLTRGGVGIDGAKGNVAARCNHFNAVATNRVGSQHGTGAEGHVVGRHDGQRQTGVLNGQGIGGSSCSSGAAQRGQRRSAVDDHVARRGGQIAKPGNCFGDITGAAADSDIAASNRQVANIATSQALWIGTAHVAKRHIAGSGNGQIIARAARRYVATEQGDRAAGRGSQGSTDVEHRVGRVAEVNGSGRCDLRRGSCRADDQRTVT